MHEARITKHSTGSMIWDSPILTIRAQWKQELNSRPSIMGPNTLADDKRIEVHVGANSNKDLRNA